MGNEEAVSNRPGLYLAYLLRLWKVNSQRQGWRASLRSVSNGELRGFGSLEALFEHLQAETAGGGRRTMDDGRQFGEERRGTNDE